MALRLRVPAHPGAGRSERELWQEALWPPFCRRLEQMVRVVPPGPAICASTGALQIGRVRVPQVSVVFILAWNKAWY